VNLLPQAREYVRRIAASGLTIYDPIEIGSDLWVPADALEVILQTEMQGHQLDEVPIRTRSKMVKQHVCAVLGYPVPKSFSRVKPRFFGQNFDVYVQAADNLQVHNDELSPSRRYVVMRPDSNGVIQRVRVVSGTDLAPFDRTGKLTKKYQARCSDPDTTLLTSKMDTPNLAKALVVKPQNLKSCSPLDFPESRTLRSIGDLFSKVAPIVGRKFRNPGILQERIRGELLHRIVAKALGYLNHADNGKFPDLRHQMLEIKFQTSSTIDLGAFAPDSAEPLPFPAIGPTHPEHRDVRYAVFCGTIEGAEMTITGLTMVTGRDFFSVFKKFGGLVINRKIQLILPKDFFDRNTEGLFD
jgi:hypothetical protein